MYDIRKERFQKLERNNQDIDILNWCMLYVDAAPYQTSLSLVEDKLVPAEAEITQLRSSLRQYENLVEEYRTQVRYRFIMFYVINCLTPLDLLTVQFLVHI
jgi:hypothetical protein